MQKTNIFQCVCFNGVSIPISLWWIPNSSHILTACFIIELCAKFLSPFIQTIL